MLIVAHLADLMTWAISLAHGQYVWKAEGAGDWDVEVARFFARLDDLDRELAAAGTFEGAVEKLVQGPLADALTHVGQLAMLRGMAGCPVRPESYARAAVTAGRVGPDQAPPGREFDGDASVRRVNATCRAEALAKAEHFARRISPVCRMLRGL